MGGRLVVLLVWTACPTRSRTALVERVRRHGVQSSSSSGASLTQCLFQINASGADFDSFGRYIFEALCVLVCRGALRRLLNIRCFGRSLGHPGLHFVSAHSSGGSVCSFVCRPFFQVFDCPAHTLPSLVLLCSLVGPQGCSGSPRCWRSVHGGRQDQSEKRRLSPVGSLSLPLSV